jgi:hypothetical protein
VSIYVKNNNSFQQSEPIARECPHCGAHAQLVPIATPSFAALTSSRPRQVGIACRCAACNEPRFVRAAVRRFEADHVELSANLVEIERAKERFPFGYLPAAIERSFREALDCYTADCHVAFAVMCRHTLRLALSEPREPKRPDLHDLFLDVVHLSEIDETTTLTLERILFGADDSEPELTPEGAAILIEIIKDMLYQCYVRTAKLKAAMRMRRYFAGETAAKVTPLKSRGRRAESA